MVSPSQITTWRRCQRKWGFDRIAKHKEQGKAAVFGERVHKVLEDWMRLGQVPGDDEAGALARKGLEYLPLPRTALGIEVAFKFDHEAVPYTGRIDLIYGHKPWTCVVISDHKTTKLRERVLTGAELLDDPQWITYAYYAAQTYSVGHVVGQWTYFLRAGWKDADGVKGPALAIPVFASESVGAITTKFHEQHRKYSLPIVESAGKDPNTLEPNTDACYDYGPCQHLGVCRR